MRIVSLVWLFTGIALMIWSVIGLWQVGHNSSLGVNSGAFQATVIAAGFSVLCIIGSLGLMLKKAWGRKLMLWTASISLLYAVAYLCFGGIEATGRLYEIIVTGLSLLSIATIIILLRKQKYKEWTT